uniref:Uncharacterized protein n=1 Tax=Glossina morsitans morsitans TaxID=37546 RepID=A0A1B0G4C1_GLOMM
MKEEGEEKISCSKIKQETEGFREEEVWLYKLTDASSKRHSNTKEQRSSKTVKDSALCYFKKIKDRCFQINKSTNFKSQNKNNLCNTSHDAVLKGNMNLFDEHPQNALTSISLETKKTKQIEIIQSSFTQLIISKITRESMAN